MCQWKQYIEEHLLKKHEEIEWIDAEEDDVFKAYIVKRTPRTYRRIARLWVSKRTNVTTSKPDDILIKTRLSTRKIKRISADSNTIHDWLLAGWIVRKVVLSNDGRTPVSEGYLMGPALFNYLENEKQLKIQQQENRFKNYQQELRQVVLPNEFNRFQKHIDYLISIDYQTFKQDSFLKDWPVSKRMRFLGFLVAILTLRRSKSTFDFKEIGAFYFKEIGGSKVFDRYKDEFITQLETLLHDSPKTLGLMSLGSITPIYFSGSIKGKFATYHIGSLHAVTDVSLLKDRFETDNKTIWLVENRAILTRMAASPKFMQHSDSLVICLDGHIRSAHRQFIKQLSNCSSVEQVIIWTDYDESGLSIAYDAYKILPGSLLVKWIARDGQVYFDYQQYSNWLQKELQTTKREQEEILGDENEWTKWINQ